MAKNKRKKDEPIGLDVQLGKSEAFIEKNYKTLLIALAAIILIIVGFFLYKSYKSSQTEKANEAIVTAQAAFAADQYEEALNGDGTTTKGFTGIINEYSGTKTANLAKAYPDLKHQIYEDDTKLRGFVNVFIDGVNIKKLNGLGSPVKPGAVVTIVRVSPS